MAVEFTWDVERGEFEETALRRAVDAALRHGGRAGVELSVVLVDDRTLADLHGRCLGDPSPTDVMSFDLSDELDSDGPVGEVVVSVERARAVAAERGVAAERELALYLVHGVLHLCGFDDVDEAERERMRAAEAEVLASLGYPPDDAPHDV